MAAPIITFGLTNRVSNSMLTEIVTITDDIGISTSGVTISAPNIYKIYKEQISNSEIKLTIKIPVTGNITINATDGTDSSISSHNYIVTPLYDSNSTLPYVSIIGDSFLSIVSGNIYSDPGAIAYDSDGNDITSEIEISTSSPNSTGILATVPDNNISVISNTIDLGTLAPATGTLIFFKQTNGLKIDGNEITPSMIFIVINPSGNLIQLANSENGNPLNITYNGNGDAEINTTNIVDTSDTGQYIITYKISNVNGIYGEPATRMVMVKSSENVSISPSNDLSISDTKIKHSLEEEEIRSYGIPYTIGDSLPSNPPLGVSPGTVDFRYIRVDGTIPFEENQSMGWNRLTDLADAILPSDAVNLRQLNNAVSQAGTPVIYTASVSQGANEAIDTLVASNYRAIKWLISIEDSVGDTYYGSEIMAVKTNSSIDFCEYNIIGDYLGYDIGVVINGTNIELKINNPLANIINVEYIRFKIS